MSSPREGAAAEAPAWKQALLERKRAKLAAGMGPERGPAPRPGEASEGREAGAVVAESLGPLRENPFMRLESERRRRRRRGACEPPGPGPGPASPAEPPALSQLLQLYGAVPGIRTIRADNILIIESCDAAAPAGPPRQGDGGGAGAGDARGAPRGRTPLRDLLSRGGGGGPVTEIRAAQVVVYEPAAAAAAAAASPGSGQVSRLLQKFDRAAKGKRRGADAPALLAPPPPSPRAARPDCPPGAQGSSSNFMRKISSNSFVVNPRGRGPGIAATSALSNGPLKLENPPARSQYGASAIPEAVPSSRTSVALSPLEAGMAGVETSPQPVPPSSASRDSRASAGPARPMSLFSSRCSFEIRPVPKPDLTAIPAHDIQAQALASLRLNSRNSFLFVPCRKEASGPPEPPEALSSLPGEALPVVPEMPAEAPVPVTNIDEDLVALVPTYMPRLKALSPRLVGFDVPQEGALALEMEESALPTYRPLSAGSVTLPQKSTSTFTIVPKKKPPAAGLETFSRAWLREEEEEEEGKSQTEAKTGALHRELGHIKKRYPTVNEIEVIGGYLSLDKSCMSKSGFRRKKMKISFNETSLQTMFEYPSESSLVEEEEEEEEEEEYATEVDEKPAFFIPHPSTTMNSNTIDSGVSSHTPKRSLGLSKWQEQQHERQPPGVVSLPWETDLSDQQVMITPAEKSHLFDFSSEPALYF